MKYALLRRFNTVENNDEYQRALMNWFRGHREGPRPEPPPRSQPMPFMTWLHREADKQRETKNGAGA